MQKTISEKQSFKSWRDEVDKSLALYPGCGGKLDPLLHESVGYGPVF